MDMARVARRTEGEYDPDAPLNGHSAAGEVVLAYLRGQVAAIRRYDPLVRLDEPDALHQMRVASRRARSALQAFGGIIEREATDPPLAPPAAREAGEVLAKPVRRAARRLQRVLDAVPGAEDRDTAIHQARKAAKRARYAAEAAVPAIGRTASRQAAQTKKLQQLLGDHHDSVVARTALLDLAGKARAAGEDTFTYGLMYERQACQATTIEEALPGESAGLA